MLVQTILRRAFHASAFPKVGLFVSFLVIALQTDAQAQDVLLFRENASITTEAAAILSDGNALWGTPPNSACVFPGGSPCKPPYSVDNEVSDNGLLFANASSSADAQAFLNGRITHPSGSRLEGVAHANGGGFISQVAITTNDPEPPFSFNSNAIIVFNASATTTGDIISGGGSADASGSVLVTASSKLSHIGSGDYVLNSILSANVSVTVNNTSLRTGFETLSDTGDVSVKFRFLNGGGEQKALTWDAPQPYGRTSAAGAALIWVNITGDALEEGRASLSVDSSNLHMLSGAPGASLARPLTYFAVSDQKITPATDNFRLVIPVVEGYGTTLPVYARYEEKSNASSTSPAANGFTFTLETDEVSFAKFSLPTSLAGGQSEFQIRFGDITRRLSSGIELDFTQFVPGGVHQFSLLGINSDEELPSDLPPTFAHRFTFTNDGTAEVAVSAIVVPESSTTWLVAMGTISILMSDRLRQRERFSNEA